MEYFTTAEQERAFRLRYQKRWEQEQDRVRTSLFRVVRRELQEQDRIFFVEPDGSVYLTEVNPNNLCPCHPVDGGNTYVMDDTFLGEVQDFTRRHSRFMIVFYMCREYSRKANIFPARMIAENEELILEDMTVMY